MRYPSPFRLFRRRARRRRPPRDPRVYLVAVMLLAGLGLVVLPLMGDALGGAMRPASGGCRVVSVVDGDTVTLWCGAGPERARLVGFDTPEVFSPGCASEWAAGMRATWALRRMLWQAEEVAVLRQGTDRYGRVLARLSLDGTDVARRMIAEGHARPYAGGRRTGWCG